MPHRTILTSFALALLSFLVVGCGSSPTSPSQDGVNLTGQFVSDGSSPLALRAQSATDLVGVTVEVLDSDGNDTGIRVAVVSNGAFTLRGLPEGAFTLIFRDESGSRIGRIRFKEVLPNQQISILVDLSDHGTVSLLSEKRNGIGHGDVELEGMASDVQLEDGHANNGTLRVNRELVVSSGGEDRHTPRQSPNQLGICGRGARTRERRVEDDGWYPGRLRSGNQTTRRGRRRPDGRR